MSNRRFTDRRVPQHGAAARGAHAHDRCQRLRTVRHGRPTPEGHRSRRRPGRQSFDRSDRFRRFGAFRAFDPRARETALLRMSVENGRAWENPRTSQHSSTDAGAKLADGVHLRLSVGSAAFGGKWASLRVRGGRSGPSHHDARTRIGQFHDDRDAPTPVVRALLRNRQSVDSGRVGGDSYRAVRRCPFGAGGGHSAVGPIAELQSWRSAFRPLPTRPARRCAPR
jgi:hypothetical protein